MLHHEQILGNVFERRKSKCFSVLMKHRRKVKDEQVTILQMAQQLKTKNVNVVPGQQFCRQCKAKFLLETDSGFPIVETILVSHPTIFFEDFPIKTDGPMGKPPLKNEDPPHLKINPPFPPHPLPH